jgi:hypothetical protein
MTREINQAIAKALHGDTLVFHDDLMATSREKLDECLRSGWFGWDNILVGESAESFCVKLPDYSGKIQYAWFLAKKIAEKTNKFYISNFCKKNKWDAHYEDSNGQWVEIEAETAPEAICLLFLELKEVHFEKRWYRGQVGW